MDLLFKVFLALHVICGIIGLFTGTINLVRIKGDKNHKLVGKIFLYSMLAAGFSAWVLSIIHRNYFLFIVGTFTIYMVGTGKRYIYLKMIGIGQKPDSIDKILTIGMMVAGFLFIGLGINHFIAQNTFAIVFFIFGILSLRFVNTDLNNYKGKIRAKNYWLLAHLQRMTGAYIAAITAFLVVNIKYVPIIFPPFVVWLLPTAILVPIIVKWTRKYEGKMKN